MLTIHGDNHFHHAPTIIIPEEEEVELGMVEPTYAFQRYHNAFSGHEAVASNMSMLPNKALYLAENPQPSDHHDFKKRLYPSTYDYLTDDVRPDGTAVDEAAHHKWANITTEDNTLEDLIEELQTAEYNYHLMMDRATGDPISQTRIREQFRKDVTQKTDVSWAVQAGNLAVWAAKVIVHQQFLTSARIVSSQMIHRLIVRTIHSFREVLTNPVAYIPQDALRSMYDFIVRIVRTPL